MKKKILFDPYDKAIIRAIGKRGERSINEIATRAGISWTTVEVHLKKLRRIKAVVSVTKNKRTYWKLNI